MLGDQPIAAKILMLTAGRGSRFRQLNRRLPSPLAQRPPGRSMPRVLASEIGAHASMIDGRSGRLRQLGKSSQPIETK